MVSAQIGHYVFVLTLLHHGDLLLDGRNVIAWRKQTEVLCVIWGELGGTFKIIAPRSLFKKVSVCLSVSVVEILACAKILICVFI